MGRAIWRDLVIGFAAQLGELNLGFTQLAAMYALADGGTMTVSGGVVPASNSVNLSTSGTYYWQAVYSGDANNNGASSLCTAVNNEKLTVTIASPTIATNSR